MSDERMRSVPAIDIKWDLQDTGHAIIIPSDYTEIEVTYDCGAGPDAERRTVRDIRAVVGAILRRAGYDVTLA